MIPKGRSVEKIGLREAGCDDRGSLLLAHKWAALQSKVGFAGQSSGSGCCS